MRPIIVSEFGRVADLVAILWGAMQIGLDNQLLLPQSVDRFLIADEKCLLKDTVNFFQLVLSTGQWDFSTFSSQYHSNFFSVDGGKQSVD